VPTQPLLGKPACGGGGGSGSSLETFQHPHACSATQEKLYQCLHTQAAGSFMQLLVCFSQFI